MFTTNKKLEIEISITTELFMQAARDFSHVTTFLKSLHRSSLMLR